MCTISLLRDAHAAVGSSRFLCNRNSPNSPLDSPLCCFPSDTPDVPTPSPLPHSSLLPPPSPASLSFGHPLQRHFLERARISRPICHCLIYRVGAAVWQLARETSEVWFVTRETPGKLWPCTFPLPCLLLHLAAAARVHIPQLISRSFVSISLVPPFSRYFNCCFDATPSLHNPLSICAAVLAWE